MVFWFCFVFYKKHFLVKEIPLLKQGKETCEELLALNPAAFKEEHLKERHIMDNRSELPLTLLFVFLLLSFCHFNSCFVLGFFERRNRVSI